MEDNMICAYCNRKKDGTKEHIIPAGILDLFPECDISIRNDVVFKGDLTIKDVCSECNNDKLGPLDAYGKKLISDLFLKEYKRDEKLTFEYDYQLLSRWLLKICYNYSRSHKLGLDWFLNNTEYLLEGIDTGAKYSVFAGLHVNTSPVPEHLFGNIKMNICHSPILTDTGFLIPVDAYGKQFHINDNLRPLDFKEVESFYNIRFGSALFVIFLWDKNFKKGQIEATKGLFNHLFRHQELGLSNVATIERCTEAMTCHMSNIVVGNLAIEIGDLANGMIKKDRDAEELQSAFCDGWSNHVNIIRRKHAERKLQQKQKSNRRKKRKRK